MIQDNLTMRYAFKIIDSPKFQLLHKIGGGRKYHQEGSAFVHSLLVFQNSFEFWENHPMNIIALLHDVGKISTGRVKPDGDWEYPNHAKVGAENIMDFLPEPLQEDNDYFVEQAKFYISNHIKPLFWTKYPEPTKENQNLAKLAICDLKASWSEVSQDAKINWLYQFLETCQGI